MMDSLTRGLMVAGLLLAAAGGLLLLAGKLPFLGRLPGDLLIRREGWSLYLPLATCLLVSLLLTILFNLFGRR